MPTVQQRPPRRRRRAPTTRRCSTRFPSVAAYCRHSPNLVPVWVNFDQDSEGHSCFILRCVTAIPTRDREKSCTERLFVELHLPGLAPQIVTPNNIPQRRSCTCDSWQFEIRHASLRHEHGSFYFRFCTAKDQSPAAADRSEITRQMLFPTSSAISNAPFRSIATPTARA
jgi:hypothetical protein